MLSTVSIRRACANELNESEDLSRRKSNRLKLANLFPLRVDLRTLDVLRQGVALTVKSFKYTVRTDHVTHLCACATAWRERSSTSQQDMARVLDNFYCKYRIFRNKQWALKSWREAHARTQFKFVIQIRANLKLTRQTLQAFRRGCLGQVCQVGYCLLQHKTEKHSYMHELTPTTHPDENAHLFQKTAKSS